MSALGRPLLVDPIPEKTISDIRNASDIVDVISEVVLLKRAGKNFQGLCPFHSEKTPSFSVSPDKQVFYCFGCGAGGNVFTFLMKHEGLSFAEAVRKLGRRHGIAVDDRQLSPEERHRMQEREGIFDVNREAVAFFRKMLTEGQEGQLCTGVPPESGADPGDDRPVFTGVCAPGLGCSLGVFFRSANFIGIPRKSRPGHPEGEGRRTLRPVQEPHRLSHPGRLKPYHRVRRAGDGRRPAEIPELA